jgi:hypothetical protein
MFANKPQTASDNHNQRASNLLNAMTPIKQHEIGVMCIVFMNDIKILK